MLTESCWVGAGDGATTEVLDWGGVETQTGEWCGLMLIMGTDVSLSSCVGVGF